MKYLLLLILLSGCGGEKEPEIPFIEIYPEITHREKPNGWLTVNGDKWTYKSHRPDYQHGFDCEKSYCKKVDSVAIDKPWISGRERKYSFDFKIDKYNFIDAPEWIIIWQDWVKVDQTNTKGPHPITTLKLKYGNDNLVKLGHFDNAWQFNYTVANPFDPSDPEDRQHNHAPNRENGSVYLELERYYHIDLIIGDGIDIESGFVQLEINGQLISFMSYQTTQIDDGNDGKINRKMSKSDSIKNIDRINDRAYYKENGVLVVNKTEHIHHAAWGQYWTAGYNTNPNECGDDLECRSNSVTIKDFKLFERYNPNS